MDIGLLKQVTDDFGLAGAVCTWIPLQSDIPTFLVIVAGQHRVYSECNLGGELVWMSRSEEEYELEKEKVG